MNGGGRSPAIAAMNTTHVSALDHTIEQTNAWLKKLEAGAFADRHQAYSGLRAVLHALRDRLTPEQAIHLGAQFPMLVRGIYYEGWKPSRSPAPDRHLPEFLARIASEFPPQFPYSAEATAEAVLKLLWEELDPGETAKVIQSMPSEVRSLWPTIAVP